MLGIKDIVRCPYCNKLYEHDFGRILSYEYNGRTVVHDLGHGCGPFVCETFRHLNARKCKLLWKYSKIYWFDNVS